MESPSPESPRVEWRRSAAHRAAARRPLTVRKRIERRDARGRIAMRTRRGLTQLQQAFDPLARPSRTRGRRILRFSLAILGSLLIHAALVGVGVTWRSRLREAAREDVKIEVRQRQPPPPPVPPAPPVPIEKPNRIPPRIVKVTPLPPPPADVPKPVRVVGLSLESTTEGGGGPSFAVGNTRLGETAPRAVAPKDVSAAPPGAAEGLRGPSPNRAAGHIPVAGVRYEMPKRRHPREPPYPSTLKSQGIEGDVPVLISIDATGRVTSVKILKPSPYPEFDEAARAAALGEEFEPATRDGIPMPYTLSFTYRFRLQEE